MLRARSSARVRIDNAIADGYGPSLPFSRDARQHADDRAGGARRRRPPARKNSAPRMVRLASPSSAETSMADLASNTIHSVSARWKTAAAVGVTNGNDNFRLAPSRDISTAIVSPARPRAGAAASSRTAAAVDAAAGGGTLAAALAASPAEAYWPRWPEARRFSHFPRRAHRGHWVEQRESDEAVRALLP